MKGLWMTSANGMSAQNDDVLGGGDERGEPDTVCPGGKNPWIPRLGGPWHHAGKKNTDNIAQSESRICGPRREALLDAEHSLKRLPGGQPRLRLTAIKAGL